MPQMHRHTVWTKPNKEDSTAANGELIQDRSDPGDAVDGFLRHLLLIPGSDGAFEDNGPITDLELHVIGADKRIGRKREMDVVSQVVRNVDLEFLGHGTARNCRLGTTSFSRL